MTTMTETSVTTQVHRMYIKATPEAIWDAITKAGVDGALRLPRQGRLRPPLMDPDMEAEGFTRLTHEIEPTADGVTRLTVIHDLADAPKLWSLLAGEQESQGAGGGWSWVLSDLKSLLETGQSLNG